MKIIKSENDLINSINNESHKKDAINILQKANSIYFLILPMIIVIFIAITSYQQKSLINTMYFNKWFIVSIGLIMLTYQTNISIARKKVVNKYLKDQKIKYKSTIFEKIDSLMLICLIISFIFI